jgi:hypothetical protein
MLANRNDFERYLQDSDLLMVPPVPAGMSILDWGRHGELMRAAYAWGLKEITYARAQGHPAVEVFPLSSPIVTVQGQSSSCEQM